MTIEERLEVLERELAVSQRRTRRLWISLGLAGAVFALVWSLTATTGSAQAQGGVKIITADQFALQAENGPPRACLLADKDGPMLLMIDNNFTNRVQLSVNKAGPGLSLRDENGKTRAWLAVTETGPILALFDENGKVIWSAP